MSEINAICFMEDLIKIYQGMDIYLNFDKSKMLLFYPASGELIPRLA